MCSFCGSALPRERPGFNDACSECRRDLHTCVNCRFFERGARWDCRETIEAPVVDKEARNHCDWYETSPKLFVASEGNRSGQVAGTKARGDFDKLFGG